MSEVVTASDGNSAPAPAASPTTFAEAFAADASSASNTPEQSNDAAAAVQPTTPEGSPQQQADERSPFIPRPRFDEVVTERNALKQFKEQYAWAEQVPREQLTSMMEFYSQFQSGDPIEALNTLASRLQADPVHGPKLRSMAAKTLAAHRGQSQPQNTGPDLNAIVVDLGNGQQFSLADFRKQILAEAEQKFAPVAQTVEQYKAEKAAAEQQAQIAQFTTSTFEDVKTWPGMDSPDNQKKVGEALKAMQIDGSDPREVALALNAAYRQVVLPTLGSKSEARLLDTLQQKAAAAHSVNPGAAANAAPANITSFHDSRLQWR